MFGRRHTRRCPVRQLMVPNTTRLAFLPVIGTTACSPLSDHARRKTGNSRRMVSSSMRSTAPSGICFNLRTIALFSVPGAALSQNRCSAAAYTAGRSVSCDGVKSREQLSTRTFGSDGELRAQPSRRWCGNQAAKVHAATLVRNEH